VLLSGYQLRLRATSSIHTSEIKILCKLPVLSLLMLIYVTILIILTLWHPVGFGDFRRKRLNARGFAREFLRSGMLDRPGKCLKRRGKSSSLHSKKFFLLGGCRFFVSDIISGGLLGHLGPLCLALGTNC